MNESNQAIVLLAHGAPERLEDIPAYLLKVRSGRPLPEAAVQEMVERYKRVGGGSPLLRQTTRQAEALARAAGWRVYVGMRNWTPYIADAVAEAARDGARRVIALCLAPQNSRTSVGLYCQAVEEAVSRLGNRIELEFMESWHDHPGLIAAFRERVTAALNLAEAEAGAPVPVIFTAHSVPEKTIAAGDPYDRQVRETARLVGEAVGPRLCEWRLAYQSQGMTPDPWIGPTVESVIDELAIAGHRSIVIAPIGFVADHLEILYDVDVVFRAYAESKGLRMVRSASLNDSPLFIAALASLVESRVKQVI